MENLCHQILKRYLCVLRTTLRPMTVYHYRHHVESLIDFLQKHYPEVDSFDKLRRSPHIEGWLQHLMRVKPHLKNNTRRKFIRNVRRFFADIREWHWPNPPPPGLLSYEDFPPRDWYLPKPLPPEVDSLLMEGLQKDGGLLCLGLILLRRTGLRIGELCHLALDCLTKYSENRYSIRVPLGKLHTEREIPVDAETAALVETIKKMRGHKPAFIDPETGHSIEFLICNPLGMARPRNKFLYKLKEIAKSLGISQNVYPHRLRHSFASELIRYGVSLPAVMKLLGHNTLKMTLRYVQVTNEDLSKAYLQAIGKARQRYSGLKPLPPEAGTDEFTQGSAEAVSAAFEELVARVQRVRFDNPHFKKRKKLQRIVERLHRTQGEIKELLEE